jgi:hypothetical protein
MFTKSLILSLSLSLTSIGCGKKDDASAPAGKATASDKAPTPTPTPAPAPAATPSAPAKSDYKADELFKATADQSYIDLMDKFKDGITVSGTIAKIDDPATGEYTAELDAGDKHVIAVTFADFGKAVKAKKLKVGDTLGATKCQPTKPEAGRFAVIQCELK